MIHITEDQEESAVAKTKSRWAALENLVGTEPRVILPIK
jgi:hypothetical protein